MFIVCENFRKFDKDDNFASDIVCSECGKPSEQYLGIGINYYCKSCLTRGIEMLDENFMKHCENDWNKRQERENEQNR